MRLDELDKYILNYAKNDKTNLALMLSGEWGCGKSYYVRNELSNFLTKNKIKVSYISLYGIKHETELAKLLFLEVKYGNQTIDITEEKTKSYGVGLSPSFVLEKILNFNFSFNGNLSRSKISKKNFLKLCENLNFKNRLVIFDDAERMGIDIKDFLGFINNLVEINNAKVLVVLNESKYLSTKKKQVKDDTIGELFGKSERSTREIEVFSDDAMDYLEIKGKTISRTLNFENNPLNVLRSISKRFDVTNNIMSNTNEVFLTAIRDLMAKRDSKNFRSVINGFQLTNDVLSSAENLDPEFVIDVLLRSIDYYLIVNERKFKLSEMESTKDVLYGFCATYIENGFIDKDIIQSSNQTFVNPSIANDIKCKLDVLYSYWTNSDKDVLEAIETIDKSLDDINKIYPSSYLKIGNYLIGIKHSLNSSKFNQRCNSCLEHIKKNAEYIRSDEELKDISGIYLETAAAREEFDNFKLYLNDHSAQRQKFNNYDYSAEHLDEFVRFVEEKHDEFVSKKHFASIFDVPKLLTLIDECDSIKISKVRRMFSSVYSFSNLKDYFVNDYENLNLIKIGIEKMLSNPSKDEILKMNLRWLVEDLEKYLSALKKGGD